MTESASERAMDSTAGQTKHKQNQEDLYRQRVLQILSPIVGEANVRSQVNLALDFSQTETTVEDYDTAGKGPEDPLGDPERGPQQCQGGRWGSGHACPTRRRPRRPPAPTPRPTTPSATDERNTIASRSTRNYRAAPSGAPHQKRHRRYPAAERCGGDQRTCAPTPQPKNDKGEEQYATDEG
jgi:flagellar M-ring protein FliF